MKVAKEDYVCELLPNIWLCKDRDGQLCGKCNVWDVLLYPKMYLEELVKDLCSESKEWKEILSEQKENGFPRFYRACMELEIKGKEKSGE